MFAVHRFYVLELSSGFLSIPTEDWASLIELTAAHGLKPKSEVGIQCVTFSTIEQFAPRLIFPTIYIDGVLVETLLSPNSNPPGRETQSG